MLGFNVMHALVSCGRLICVQGIKSSTCSILAFLVSASSSAKRLSSSKCLVLGLESGLVLGLEAC